MTGGNDTAGRPALLRAMGAAFGLALVVRLVYVFAYRGSPYFDHPMVDADWADSWAAAWARGEWSITGEAFFRAPLYPFFISLLYRGFGHDYLIVRLAQALLGAGTAAAVAGTGVRLFGSRAGMMAGLIAALYGPLVYFDGELLIPALLVPLLAWCAFFLAGRTRWWIELAAAALLGLAVVARPNALVLLPLLLAAMFFRRRLGAGRTLRLGHAAIALLVALAPALAVTAINWHQSGALVFVSSQGGVNFYAGNHPTASGRNVQIPGLDNLMNWREFVERAETVPEMELGRPLNAAEVSRYWADKGLRWIGDHPGDAARLYVRKLYYLANGFEVPNNRDLYLYQPWPLRPLLWKIPFLAFPWGIVFPLAVVGLVAAWRTEGVRGRAWMLLGWIALYGLSLLPFFICARFRMGLVLPVILLAGYALGTPGVLKRRGALLAGLVALLVANSAFFGVRQENLVEEQVKYAATLLERGDMDLGMALLEEAAKAEPNQVAPNYLLADAYLESGNAAKAREYFERVADLRPGDAKVRFSLGAVLLQLGDWENAARELEVATRIDPEDAATWVDLGVANEELGDTARAEAAYRNGIDIAPVEIGYYRLAGIYIVRGNLDEAVHVLDEGVARNRTSFPLRYQLSVALAKWGRLGRAAAEVDTALALKPGDATAARLKAWLDARLAEEPPESPTMRPPGGE